MDFQYTQDEVKEVATALLKNIRPVAGSATVVGLTGDLGAGKTTLVQAVAEILGVQENVGSPTFVIAKFYETNSAQWKQLVHIDAYRIEEVGELVPLGWETLIHTPETLIIVEWAERITEALPQTATRFMIEHTQTGRHIQKI